MKQGNPQWHRRHVQNWGYFHTREGTIVAAIKSKAVRKSGLAPSDCDEPFPALSPPNVSPASA